MLPEQPAATRRPRLLLFLAPYDHPAKNVIAATLAWLTKQRQSNFEVYYDAVHLGQHLGSDPRMPGRPADEVALGLLTGGPISGGRHLEALWLSLLRFDTTVVSCGSLAFDASLAALAADGRVEVLHFSPDHLVPLYDWAFARFNTPWPESALLVDRDPRPELCGIDAYLYPEIFYPRRLGLEASISEPELAAIAQRGVRRILVAGAGGGTEDALRAHGFEVVDSGLVADADDFASVSRRLATRWQAQRQGWVLGDPTLVASWLPTACREDRIAIYGIPQAAVLKELEQDLRSAPLATIIGRQSEDGDFFSLSALGQSLQVIDPCRPPLPVLTSLPAEWPLRPPPFEGDDPTDAQLEQWANEGRILTSLVFWTGMIRETENLFALADLISMTGLRAGFVISAQTLAWRPSPLDLMMVPARDGGLYPLVELLMGSAGDGVSIESLLTAEQLAAHLAAAERELDRLAVPAELRPRGWWATMDAPLVSRSSRDRPSRIRWKRGAPFGVQLRFHRRSAPGVPPARPAIHPNGARPSLRARLGTTVRRAGLDRLFLAYRPYEHFAPGSLDPALARVVRAAGYDYMLTKSEFGRGPTVAFEENGFVAINYTAGQWDGWTPFETINDVADLRQAEKRLLRNGKPGWLLGGIDSCLWTFSGELWNAAPRLHAIAEFATNGGTSGRLINVRPGVLARYARLIGGSVLKPERQTETQRGLPA